MRGIWRSLFSIAFVSGSALPAVAAECAALKIVTSLPIRPIAGGRPAIEVKIGDTAETLLVDTGGAFSDLNSRTVRELKLTPTRTNVRSVNIKGQTSDQAVRLPSITIGSLRQEGAYFQVAPGNNPNDTGPQDFAGVLGPDFLQKFDADFDFVARRLNLIAPDHCEGKVVYWTAPAVAVIPVHVAQFGHVIFPMTLDGKRVQTLLDTGATDTVMNLNVAQRLFDVDVNSPDVAKVGEIAGGYTANVYRRRFKMLEVEGVTIADPEITLLPNLMGAASAPRTGSLVHESDDVQGLPDLILGMSVLSKLHVYVAYKESKLYLTSATPRPSPNPPAAAVATGAFCPSPSDPPSDATAAPAPPTIGAGMTALQRRNYPLAYANLRPLADMGNIEAERDLGLLLRQSCPRNDKSMAASWFQKAAEAGDVQAAAALGDMHMFGDGIAQDDAAAFRWVTQAANAGRPGAQTELGELYFTGRGVAQDGYQGMAWSVRAGEQGAPIALIHIGREYANGRAVPKDNAKAVFFMTVGIQRAPAGRRNEFTPALQNIKTQLSVEEVNNIQRDAQKWMPGPGSLSQVVADADKQRGQVP